MITISSFTILNREYVSIIPRYNIMACKGGGIKCLFRKINDRSAEYLPDHDGNVRRNGSFIYEEFLTTGGTDVKVYTVRDHHCHRFPMATIRWDRVMLMPKLESLLSLTAWSSERRKEKKYVSQSSSIHKKKK